MQTPVVYKCKHDICSYIGVKGLRYECHSLDGYTKHTKQRHFHPCCQNESLCYIGKLITKEQWSESECRVPKAKFPCLHLVCRQKFNTNTSLQSHIRKSHPCITKYAQDCEECHRSTEIQKEREIIKLETEKKHNEYLRTQNNQTDELGNLNMDENFDDNNCGDNFTIPIPITNELEDCIPISIPNELEHIERVQILQSEESRYQSNFIDLSSYSFNKPITKITAPIVSGPIKTIKKTKRQKTRRITKKK